MYRVKIFIRRYRLPKNRYAVAAWFTVDEAFKTADEASKWAAENLTACKAHDIQIFKIPETNQEKGT